MQPSDREEARRNGVVVGAIAVLALLGLILAVLVASCSGEAAPGAATGVSAETEAPEAAPATTGSPGETEVGTEPVETDAAEPGPAVSASEPDVPTLVDAAAGAETFATLVRLLERSGLDESLAQNGPYTVFAPTDEAFDALPEELLAALENDPDALARLLSFHIVHERTAPGELVPGSLITVDGAALEIAERDGRLYAADAPIVEPAVEAANGRLHPIGYVLFPPDLDLASLAGEEAAARAYDRADFVVFFATGSAELDSAGQETIAEAASEIEGLPQGSRVRLVGVADPTGDAAANLELSRQRARAVEAALRQAAPAAQARYVVRASGEEVAPKLANARRVDIVLVPSG